MNNRKKAVSIHRICNIAIAIILNVIGGKIALYLRLPVYLDSMGTILTAVLYGPLWGTVPPILYGLIAGITGDIFAFYLQG